jgi:hypothetical protein
MVGVYLIYMLSIEAGRSELPRHNCQGVALQGQAHGRHRRTSLEYQDDSMHVPPSGSPLAPGSPLTYSPQIAMEPLSKNDEFQRGGSVYGQSEFAGWAAQPKLVPTVLVCEWSSRRLPPSCCRRPALVAQLQQGGRGLTCS